MQAELEQTYPRLGTIYSLCSVYYPNIRQRSDVLNRWNFLKTGFYEGINPGIYLQEEIYADVVARNIVPFPLRFDYDVQENSHQELLHPKSHLTLGQYQNCRIPVTAPMTPIRFVDFVLRNFYHTAFIQYADGLPTFSESFDESISLSERNVVHVVTPP